MTNSIFNLHNYFLNFYAIPHFLVGVFISLEGIFVFTQSKKSIVHIGYLLTTVTAGAWLTGVGLGCLASNEAVSYAWYRYVSFFGIIFVTPAVYLFSVSWDDVLFRKKIKTVYFNYFTAFVFYVICISSNWIIDGLWHYSTGFFPKAGFLEWVFITWFYIVMTLAFINFIRTYRKENTLTGKKNAKLTFIGFAIAFFGSVEYLPNYGIHIFPAAFFPVFLFTSIMGYCVIRYKLMDIETVIHKTIGWLLTSAALIAPPAVLLYFTRNWYASLSPLFACVYLVVALLGFLFFSKVLQPRVDRFFQRRHGDLQAVLDHFSRELVHLKTLEDLLDRFIQTLQKNLFTRQISIYLRDESGKTFSPVRTKGAEGLQSISAEHSFLKWLEEQDRIVVADLAESDPELKSIRSDVQKYFQQVQALLIVPLVLGEKMIGVMHFGKKENLKNYTSVEIHFLFRIKTSMTIAISNSLQAIAMQESLKRWNVELEKKVDERTKELVDTQQQLVQAEKLATLGTLAGGVAHEINNPLTAVLTNAQILKMDARPEDLESLNLIEDGAKRCRAIVQKMMKYARKSEGVEAVEKVNANKAVTSVVRFLQYQFEQDNVTLKVEESGTEAIMLGNLNELEQVLTNLLLNARDATRELSGEKKVEVKVTDDIRNIGFVVSDNGVGIPKENLSKIFDPFFTTKDVGKGTGLGLAVTQSIVQKFGGRIEVASEVGKGTKFAVGFPKVTK